MAYDVGSGHGTPACVHVQTQHLFVLPETQPSSLLSPFVFREQVAESQLADGLAQKPTPYRVSQLATQF